jgi:hypothetical protein
VGRQGMEEGSVKRDKLPMCCVFGQLWYEIPQTFEHDPTLPFWGSCVFSRQMGKGIAFLNAFESS